METKAIPINNETYEFAVACLPPMFVTVPRSKLIGAWLVINDISVFWSGNEQHITINNEWFLEEGFTEIFRFRGGIDKMGFRKVYRH